MGIQIILTKNNDFGQEHTRKSEQNNFGLLTNNFIYFTLGGR
jgi:hypothetical protein